jgi:hypothetical protein
MALDQVCTAISKQWKQKRKRNLPDEAAEIHPDSVNSEEVNVSTEEQSEHPPFNSLRD